MMMGDAMGTSVPRIVALGKGLQQAIGRRAAECDLIAG
jgi:hypothetical protein